MLPYEMLIGFRTLFIRSNGCTIKRTYLKKLNNNNKNAYNLYTISPQNKLTFEFYYNNININNVKKFCQNTSFTTNFIKEENESFIKDKNVFGTRKSNRRNVHKSEENLKINENLETWIYSHEENPPTNHITKKFSNPLTTLQKIYSIVDRELQCKSLTIKFHQKNMWFCTHEVTWPENKKFITKAYSKKRASLSSALKCLCWLNLNKKINMKSEYPIIYGKDEMKSILESNEELKIENSVLKEVEDFLDQYESIIEKKTSNDGNNTTENQEDLIFNVNETVQRNLIYDHPISNFRENPIQRNYYLGNNLNNRNNATNLNLPIMNYKAQILEELKENQILIIKGDTGCGKSTQVPQFIIDYMTELNIGSDCSMIISQPRRISAISIAERVAFERNENVGDVVGYQVRLQQRLPKQNGSILFCTTGVLLKKLQSNPTLNGCSHVVIDEAHERSVETDFLLILLKRAIEKNSSLKLIVMSATLNAHLFQDYFNCRSIEIPGKLFDVKMNFLDEINELKLPIHSVRDNPKNEPFVNHELIVELIRWISKNKPPGSILCFLPGWYDISYIQNILNKNPIPKQLVIPLHSSLSHLNKNLIFTNSGPDIRKIILATDVAETGITVPDVIYVIDSACHKSFYWDEDKSLSYTILNWISRANLNQRKGRAGRVTNGESYHLITKQKFNELEEYPLPEILRVSLEKSVLDCKRYTDESVEDFLGSMLQPPRLSSINKAVVNLEILGALDEEEKLTALGEKLVMFHVDPKLSKAIVYSSFFQCLGKMLAIASNLSLDSGIFYQRFGHSSTIREMKLGYHSSSDHIAEANIYEDWKQNYLHNPSSSRRYSEKNFLTNDKMRTLFESIKLNYKDTARAGLVRYINNLSEEPKLEQNNFSSKDELVLGVLLAGTDQILHHRKFSYKKGRFTKNTPSIITESSQSAYIVSEGVNYKFSKEGLRSPYLTYFRKQVLGSHIASVYDSSMILPITVLLFSQGAVYMSYTKSADNVNKVTLTIDRQNNVKINCDEKTAKLILRFRNLMWSVVRHYIENHVERPEDAEILLDDSKNMNYYKMKIINIVLKLLSESPTINNEDCR